MSKTIFCTRTDFQTLLASPKKGLQSLYFFNRGIVVVVNSSSKRHATVFPKDLRYLEEMGVNIQLARKRRQLTQLQMCERTGLDPKTVRKIEKGEPSVSIGHYISVLAVLGLSGDVIKVAADDQLGRKLQDIALIKRPKGQE